MAFCSQCGVPINENAKYCPDCGAERDSPRISDKPYTRNNVLIADFIFVLISLIAFWPIWVILTLFAIWNVYDDGKKIGAGKAFDPKTGLYNKGLSPLGWALLSIIPIGLLAYLVKRKKIYDNAHVSAVHLSEENKEAGESSSGKEMPVVVE